LAKHVGVNTRSKYGETALDVAARTGDAEAAELLLDVGADPTAVNKRSGDTPTLTSLRVGAGRPSASPLANAR